MKFFYKTLQDVTAINFNLFIFRFRENSYNYYSPFPLSVMKYDNIELFVFYFREKFYITIIRHFLFSCEVWQEDGYITTIIIIIFIFFLFWLWWRGRPHKAQVSKLTFLMLLTHHAIKLNDWLHVLSWGGTPYFYICMVQLLGHLG